MNLRRTVAAASLALLLGTSFATTFTFVADETEARYRVREQLAGVSFPGDAIGATRSVQGVIHLGDDGVLGPDSRIDVDVASLASDQRRRDDFVRRNTLQTDAHPTVTFVPQRIDGLTLPLPSEGEDEVLIHGELTIRGATRPATWTATITYREDGAHLQARTTFTFEDFGLTKPRVASVLSVADEITLELDAVVIAVSEG